MRKCESCLEICVCYTCKKRKIRTDCDFCDICDSGDMSVCFCNQYEDEREDKK